MDLLYIPQLDEDGGTSSSSPSRYRVLDKVVESGAVQLTDHCVNRITLDTPDTVKIILPPHEEGFVRDFFVRLVITADALPEIMFTPQADETFGFEDQTMDALSCQVGINIFSFTETGDGIFIVNCKQIDIEKIVAFDSCGGTLSEESKTYNLGYKYGAFPSVVRDGYSFEGWFTAEHDGVEVTVNDTVKTGVSKLYAQWSVYVDPYVDSICPKRNLTFFSSGNRAWTIDSTTYSSGEASAKSGAITDTQTSALTTSVTGPGTIKFKWKVSSEAEYDPLKFYVDNVEKAKYSGDQEWAERSFEVASGIHTLKWQYEKDISCSSFQDCGWVDDVDWTPSETGT